MDPWQEEDGRRAADESETLEHTSDKGNERSAEAETPKIESSAAPANDGHDPSDSQDRYHPSSTINPRLEALAAKKAALEETLASLQAERAKIIDETHPLSSVTNADNSSIDEKAKAALTAANVGIQNHIARLKKYNEIKDVGQGLMGLIAEMKGSRMGAVMDDFGMTEDD